MAEMMCNLCQSTLLIDTADKSATMRMHWLNRAQAKI